MNGDTNYSMDSYADLVLHCVQKMIFTSSTGKGF